MNLALVGMTAANLGMRRGKRAPSGVVETLLNGVGVAGLVVSQWYGADLVYRHGMRVKDQPGQGELRPPRDESAERALHGVSRHFPSSGIEERQAK